MDQRTIRTIPKVELHCHLDGSVSMEALKEISGGTCGDLTAKISAPVPCGSLKQYLTCFDVILPFLQTEQALEIAAQDVIRQAAQEHVCYLETRFAPGFHCRGGLTEEQALGAVLRGLEAGEQRYGVKARAIACLMRGMDHDYNVRTLNCARDMLGHGLVALDLAGNEAAYPPEEFRDLFDRANALGIPFTLHAGECGSSENVRRSVEMGARRIGHGVAIADDEAVKVLCREKGICLEMCPVSNLQTKAAGQIESYPFLRMQREGLHVCINTDNRTVSGTSLTREWSVLCGAFPGITEELIRQTNLDAARAAFLPDYEIRLLVEDLQKA